MVETREGVWTAIPARGYPWQTLRYRRVNGAWVVGATEEIDTYVPIQAFIESLQSAALRFDGTATVDVDHDRNFIVSGDRPATEAEVARIEKHRDQKRRATARAKERKAEADLRALAAMRKRFPEQFVPLAESEQP